MITITNLLKRYSNFTLKIPSFEFKEGSIWGLLGNNGAGKTTLLRSILDLVKIDKGSVKIGNHHVNKSEKWKHFTGSYLDESFLIDHLTPLEYFKISGSLYGKKKDFITKKIVDYKHFLNSVDTESKLIRDLSEGNKKKVGVISAIIIEPKVLILDEPFANLDPSSKLILNSILNQLNEQCQTTILISSHDLYNINEISQNILILEDGQIEDNNYKMRGLDKLKSAF